MSTDRVPETLQRTGTQTFVSQSFPWCSAQNGIESRRYQKQRFQVDRGHGVPAIRGVCAFMGPPGSEAVGFGLDPSLRRGRCATPSAGWSIKWSTLFDSKTHARLLPRPRRSMSATTTVLLTEKGARRGVGASGLRPTGLAWSNVAHEEEQKKKKKKKKNTFTHPVRLPPRG